MNEGDTGFIHRYEPGQGSGQAPVLLLLHGTGGDETSLLRLGELLAPGLARLSPRGKVLENGMPRFFRRLAEGVFDLDDLKFRTHELAGFVRSAVERYGVDPGNVIAVGYSNGANIAASLLLQEPGLLRAAVLFRAMIPFEPETVPELGGTPVYLASGLRDELVPSENSARLAEMLREAGAEVDLHWTDGVHRLSAEDVAGARDWLARHFELQLDDVPGSRQ